jgi:hypothetical protein
MRKARQLVPQAVLFGKVIAYECAACGRKFSTSLLYGAVPSNDPPPATVRDAFFHHVCKGKAGEIKMTSSQGVR